MMTDRTKETRAVSTLEVIGRIREFEQWLIDHPLVALECYSKKPLIVFALYEGEKGNLLISVSGLTLYSCIDFVLDSKQVKEYK